MTDHAQVSARGESTRTALLRAAVHCVVETGWQATGARAITARAGVPLGALNYHFGGKEELLRAATMVEIHRMFGTPRTVIAASASVDVLVDGMVGWCRAPDVDAVHQALLLEVMSQARRDPTLSDLLGHGLSDYRRELALALHRLGVAPNAEGTDEPSEQAQDLADGLAAQCNGLWLQFLIEPGRPTDPATATAAAAWKAALMAATGQPGATHR